MKNILIVLSLIMGVSFFYQGKVYAEEGPIIIQAVVEYESAPEITVKLVKENYEQVKEYKLNKENNWYVKDNVPVGKYKILSYAEDLSVISQSLLQFEKRTVEVISNPVKTDAKDETPRLNTIYGGKDYMRSFKGMVAYVRADGTMLHGVVSYDEMKGYLDEAVSRQTGASKKDNDVPKANENTKKGNQTPENKKIDSSDNEESKSKEIEREHEAIEGSDSEGTSSQQKELNGFKISRIIILIVPVILGGWFYFNKKKK